MNWDMNKYLTIKKVKLPHQPGDSTAIKPAGDYKRVAVEYDNDPVDDPITIKSVSIVVVTKETKQYLECEIMHDNIVVPDARCMFYVRVQYPWRIKSGAWDTDEILTDGELFYLATRNLAKTPFKLNDYSKTKLTDAIAEFCGDI